MMLRSRLAVAVACGLNGLAAFAMPGSALAQDYARAPTSVLMEIMPDDVVSFVERADACIHYAGTSRLVSLRCADLGSEHAVLTQKYEKDMTVSKGLQFVKRNYLP
jgi:hypothetical protein